MSARRVGEHVARGASREEATRRAALGTLPRPLRLALLESRLGLFGLLPVGVPGAWEAVDLHLRLGPRGYHQGEVHARGRRTVRAQLGRGVRACVLLPAQRWQ